MTSPIQDPAEEARRRHTALMRLLEWALNLLCLFGLSVLAWILIRI